MVDPFVLKPVYMERIWGGRALEEKYGKSIPEGLIGESWEISCHPHGMSLIDNGAFKGWNLQAAIEAQPEEILGLEIAKTSETHFPLLVKFLDARDTLSVQVHPDDAYAAIHEKGELGKAEAWYIIDAKPGARLVYGTTEGCMRDGFSKAAREGTLEHCMNWINVQAGDVLYIPAGMLHAIGDGILICEIQQNSDTVYRVFDWNRVDDKGNPRQLQLEKALNVIDFTGKHRKSILKGVSVEVGTSIREFFVIGPYFALEVLRVKGEMEEETDASRFFTYSVVSGSCKLKYKDGNVESKAGDSLLIPAVLGKYRIVGDCVIIKAYVPDIKKMKKYLLNKGCTPRQILELAGWQE